MKTKKMVAITVLSILILMAAQVLAQIIASVFIMIKIPEFICNIVAGKKKFKENFIIVDMGTAITFDIAGKDGFHIGEVFVPDINIAMDSMTKKCSLLKNENTKFKYQDFVIGKTTREAINGGIFYKPTATGGKRI